MGFDGECARGSFLSKRSLGARRPAAYRYGVGRDRKRNPLSTITVIPAQLIPQLCDLCNPNPRKPSAGSPLQPDFGLSETAECKFRKSCSLQLKSQDFDHHDVTLSGAGERAKRTRLRSRRIPTSDLLRCTQDRL